MLTKYKHCIFTAVKFEDLSHQTVEDGQMISHFEEDKNYDVTGNFTNVSPAAFNTLVSFFDISIEQFRSSNNLSLGFYNQQTNHP